MNFQQIKNEFVKNTKTKGQKTLNPVVVALIGLVGSGKSTLAREIGKVLGWQVIENDKIRVMLRENGEGFNLQNTHEIVSAMLHKILKVGGNVILDSDFIDSKKRKKLEYFAKKFSAKTIYIRTFCDKDLMIERLLKSRYNKKIHLFSSLIIALREHIRRFPWHYTWSKKDGGNYILKKLKINFFAEVDTTKLKNWMEKLKTIAKKLNKF